MIVNTMVVLPDNLSDMLGAVDLLVHLWLQQVEVMNLDNAIAFEQANKQGESMHIKQRQQK
jgi:hypothetical protein